MSRLETEKGVGLRFAAQFIHQESVGEELLESAAGSTWALGAKVDLSFRRAVCEHMRRPVKQPCPPPGVHDSRADPELRRPKLDSLPRSTQNFI